MALPFNNIQTPVIQPVSEVKPIEKYHNTQYHDAYQKGILTAKMTLDVKNKHKIVENLIKIIFDDISEQSQKTTAVSIGSIKSYNQIIETVMILIKSHNFTFDVTRISCIIEGYGKYIEQQNNG
jgi:ABC-type uncharacterized transport system fused permease/ATPase subunit